MSTPHDRVRAVLRAARRIADPGDALGREARARLPGVARLSPANVELGLTRHLETDATAAELGAFVSSAGCARGVHVVLASNVFVAPVRALALALAAAERVTLRPSRRDPVVAELLARALDGEQGVHLSLSETLDAAACDVVHAYGADATLDVIASGLPRATELRRHGSGFGVVVVEGCADTDAAAFAIASDVVPFDQRGCLSPRIVLADAAGAPRIAASLARALVERAAAVPPGPLDLDERAERALFVARAAMTGEVWDAPGGVVALELEGGALLLPPTGRCVVVRAVGGGDAARALLAPLARGVTSVGASSDGPLALAVASLCPGARRARLGAMQRPPLDGPVDLRAAARC